MGRILAYLQWFLGLADTRSSWKSNLRGLQPGRLYIRLFERPGTRSKKQKNMFFITGNYRLSVLCFSNQTWRVEMNLFTKNIRGFVDLGKQAEPKNPSICYRIAIEA